MAVGRAFDAVRRLFVPPSTTNVSIRTSGDTNGFVRMSYEHTDEVGEPVISITDVGPLTD